MSGSRTGRPRSEASRQSILRAVAQLVTESGYDRVTIEGIAARAGAGKQTIYRWWSSKARILAEAVAEGYLTLPFPAISDTGSLHADLTAWTVAITESLNDPAARQAVRALAAAASDDEPDASRLYQHTTGPYRALLVARLRAGGDAGQLSAEIDPSPIADALLGAVLFRLLAGLPFDENLAVIVNALVENGREHVSM